MPKKICNKCGKTYQDNFFSATSGKSYCNECKSTTNVNVNKYRESGYNLQWDEESASSSERPKPRQILMQEQESAYEMELAISTFHNMLEPLEEYVGKIDCYPDWNNRRRLYRNTIKDSNDTVEGFEDLFLTQLLIVTGAIGKKPADFRKEVQKEYNRWISAVGIDANNIPPQAGKLGHYLFEINEVLEGRGEKIFNQTKELVKGQNISPQDALWFTSASQGHFSKSDERKKALKGKKFNELGNKSRFGTGDEKKGEQSISRIAGTVADKHKDFRFYPQAVGGEGGGGLPPGDSLDRVVRDVKANPQNWNLDEIPTEVNFFGGVKKQEFVLYRWDARLEDYREGKLNFDRNPVYLWEIFNVRQRFEIKSVKKIFGDYLTNEEIKWVVGEVKDNPRIWRIGPFKGHDCLIHGSAQGGDNEIGTLIHDIKRFNEKELAEINGAFERVKFIDDIKQNASLERGLFVINRDTGERSENDDWFIHNQLEREFDNKTGYLIYVPNSMIRVKDLTEAEQKAIGYKSETSQQNHTTDNRPRGGGGYGSSILFGSFSIISLIGLAFTR